MVGSITHCAGYTGAAVAHRTEVLTIGVDAEPNEPLPDGVLRLTAGAGESDQLDSLAAHDPAVHWGRLLFCAKEALFKAWYPVQQQWLGFADASIRLDPGGTFRARLITPTPGAGRFADCPGRWTLDGGVLLTALWLPAGA